MTHTRAATDRPRKLPACGRVRECLSAPSCPGKESDFGQSCGRESQWDQEVEGGTGGSGAQRWGRTVICEKKTWFCHVYGGFPPKGCGITRNKETRLKKEHSNLERTLSLFSRQWESGGGEAGERSSWREGEELLGGVWCPRARGREDAQRPR